MLKKMQKGFSLVQLSVAIFMMTVILALLALGHNYVKKTQLYSIIKEQEQVKNAVYEFRKNYGSMPGDYQSADLKWPKCREYFKESGCNGNGDWIVAPDHGLEAEIYKLWIHLFFADLYPMPFLSDTIQDSVLGINIPASKFTPAGITVIFDDQHTNATAGDGLDSGGRNLKKNIIIFGGVQSKGFGIANATVFSASQVKKLDEKIDDGNPVSGNVIAVGKAGSGEDDCIDNTVEPNIYNIDAKDLTPCSIAFVL